MSVVFTRRPICEAKLLYRANSSGKDAQGYVFDILEPHDSSRKDNYPKAVGLAKFAKKHWDIFGRIQLIRLKKGVDGREHFYRLDMAKTTIRNKVRGITSNEELDRMFDTDAVRED